MTVRLHTTLLLLLLFNISATAQFRWGLKAGVQQASLTLLSDTPDVSYRGRIGVQAGLVTDIALSRSLAIQPSLMVSSKGYKYSALFINGNTGTIISTIDGTVRPFYIELAAPALYRFSVNQRVRFFAGAGPYGAVGVGGTIVQNLAILPAESDITFGPSSSYSQFRRFDYGYTVVAGVELSQLILTANYTNGLAKVTSGYLRNNPPQTRTIGFTIGFLVGGKSSEQAPVYFKK